MKSNTAGNKAPADAALDPKALEAIGRALRAHYDDLLHAPLPDKFFDLLSQLEAAEQRANQDGGRNDAK
jgi:Anti-sigma factor NepR